MRDRECPVCWSTAVPPHGDYKAVVCLACGHDTALHFDFRQEVWTKEVEIGSRIRLMSMDNDPCPIEPGDTGEVTGIVAGRLGQLWVKWDSGRSLNLVPGDRFEIIYLIEEIPA